MSEHFTEADPALEIAALWQGNGGNLQPGDVTIDQMAAAWGCTESLARERLRAMEKQGAVEKLKRNRAGDGHVVIVWRKVV